MTLAELLAKLGLTAADIGLAYVDLTDPRLTVEQLKAVEAKLESLYAERRAEAAPSVAVLSTIRQAKTVITGEATRREHDAAELVRMDAEAAAAKPKTPEEIEAERIAAEAGKTTTVVVDPATLPPGATAGTETVLGTDGATVDPAAVTVAGVGVSTAQPTDADIQLAKVANAQVADAKDGTVAPGTPPVVRFRTASALTGGGQLGTELTDISEIGAAVMDAAVSIGRATESGVNSPTVYLASLPALVNTPGFDKEGALMADHGAAKNTEIIRTRLRDHGDRLAAARGGRAHTAAAPWCEPFDTIRTIPDCIDTRTPVRDSLPFIPMGYGGFNFNTGVSLADLTDAIDVWTPADQAAIDPTDPDTWKRCLTLECPVTLPQITLDNWLTACLEWQIGTDLNNPERFRDYFRKLEGARARLAEQYLLALLDALTINYTNNVANLLLLGGLPDFVASLIQAFQGYEYDERAIIEMGYTLYMDSVLIDAIAVSEIRAAEAKTDGTRAGIIAYILAHVPQLMNVVVPIDRVPGSYGTVGANGNPKTPLPAAGGAPVVVKPLAIAGRIRMIPTAEVFAFGTGELRTGVRQDFSYARQNKVGWFAEEALALTKYGCSPWFAMNLTIQPNGIYSGTIDYNVTLVDPFVHVYTADNAAADEPDPNP